MQTLNISIYVLGFLIILALLFDFMNGFHDAANAIATVVSTGVLKPSQAVAMAAFFNVLAIAVFQLKVATTVGKDTIDPMVVDHYVVFGALVGAITWNFITWFYVSPLGWVLCLVAGASLRPWGKKLPSSSQWVVFVRRQVEPLPYLWPPFWEFPCRRHTPSPVRLWVLGRHAKFQQYAGVLLGILFGPGFSPYPRLLLWRRLPGG